MPDTIEALLLRPELRTLGGRDFRPLRRSRAIACSSSHVRMMRMRSITARLSSASPRLRSTISSIRLRVYSRRDDICSSGGIEKSGAYNDANGPAGGEG